MNQSSRPAIAVFELSLKVSADAVDELGHVNNTVFVQWMQDAAVAHSAAVGWSLERYREIGAAWIARSHHIEYLIPAFEDDSILIQTWVSGFKKVMSWRRYNIFRMTRELQERELIAKGETKWAFVGLESMRPTRVPEVMKDSFTVVEG